MTHSQTSPRHKKGFQTSTFTANDIYTEHGILAKDIQLIAEKFGVRLPCTATQKGQILEFADIAKQQGKTIKQAIYSLQDEQASQVDTPSGFNSAPTGSWSQEPSLETEFSNTEAELLQAAELQAFQNELAVAQTNGFLMEAQTQLALANGRKRMGLMLQGLIEPSNADEARLVESVRRATGINQQKMLPFVRVGTGANGQLQMMFQAIAPTGNTMNQALQLMAASNGTGIIPQTPLAQLMEQLQSGGMPTLQATQSLLPQLQAAPTETQAIAEELDPEPPTTTEVAVEPSPAPTDL